MSVKNNISFLSSNNGIQKNNSSHKKYCVTNNTVDKTPGKDTVQLSTSKKIGIGVGILALIASIYYLVRGKKPSGNVTNKVKQFVHETTTNIQKPKMQMTDEAKKIYQDTSKKLHQPPKKINAETIEQNLTPKQKENSWDSKDIKEFYTQLEKESDAKKILEKQVKKLEEKATKELEDLNSHLKDMSPRELSQVRYDLTNDIRKIRFKHKCYSLDDILSHLSQTEKIEFISKQNKLDLIDKQLEKNEKSVEHLIPKVFKGSSVPQHHELNGCNSNIRNAIELQEEAAKGKILDSEEKEFVNRMTKYMDKVDESFETLPPLEKRCVGYRGRTENPISQKNNTDFAIIENAKPGDIIVPDTGYSYAGFKRSLADAWGGPGAVVTDMQGKPTRQIMYTIYYPEGAKVSRNLEHGGEIVAPRGSEYVVLSKNTDKNGFTEVVMEYVLPKK